jgi:hypothetical protein
MPDKAVLEERKNRVLKQQISQLTNDSQRLTEVIYELEQENIKLVEQNINVDLEMKYVLDEGLVEEVKLPPVQPSRYKVIQTKDKDTEKLVKDIIGIEISKRAELLNEFGIIGQQLQLEPTSKMGPTRFYGSLVETIDISR